MKVTVSASEPLLLREAKPGDLCLLHVPGFEEGIFAPLLGAHIPMPDYRDQLLLVCVACRVGPGDRRHVVAGSAIHVHADSPITLLDQVEPAALRARPAPFEASIGSARAPNP